MAVCQYYLQGRCRFGQNCRFEHSYNSDDRNTRNSANSQQLSNVVRQIVGEVILAEKGGQWPLSCFSPVKEGMNIPGWEDISPEEVRWKMYEARANGTLNQCINEINQLYSEAEKRRNILKQPTAEIINTIVNVLKGKKELSNTSNPFSSSGKFDSSSSNIFGGSSQSTGTQNIFGNSPQTTGSHGNIFGGSSPSSGPKGNIFGSSGVTQGNIFGGTSPNFSNQNVFGGANTSNSFSQNVFSSPPVTSQNLFSSSAAASGNIFSNSPVQNIFSNTQITGQGNSQNLTSNVFSPASSSNIFSSQGSNTALFGSQNSFFANNENKSGNQTNVFGGAQNENIFQSPNTFGKSSSNVFGGQQQSGKNIFGGQAQQTNSGISIQERPNALDMSVYSKVEDLSEEEINSFSAPTFTFGKIPLKPPPQEYCK